MDKLGFFEIIARKASLLSITVSAPDKVEHPFEIRNLHPKLPTIVRTLFDDGHYSQATFEAFKYLDKLIARISSQTESGFKLMMQVFNEEKPQIRLTPCSTTSEKDEQQGYRFLFAGSILAIRNPRGHEVGVIDSVDECLDHLALASILMRRLEDAGFNI